jgi:transcriptional regulator with AAA-type ATPase domain
VDRAQFLQQVSSLRSEGKSIRAIAAGLGMDRGRVDRDLVTLTRTQTNPPETSIPSGHHGRPFVGRQREMATLTPSLDLAVSGRGQIALLAGDPGIGKTRTASELAHIAEQNGAQVFWATATRAWARLPIGPGSS